MLNDEKFLDDPRRAVQLGLGFYSPLWPTFIAAAGAGVAFWAWAQWMRGKAQSEFSPALAGAPASAVSPVAATPDVMSGRVTAMNHALELLARQIAGQG